MLEEKPDLFELGQVILDDHTFFILVPEKDLENPERRNFVIGEQIGEQFVQVDDLDLKNRVLWKSGFHPKKSESGEWYC